MAGLRSRPTAAVLTGCTLIGVLLSLGPSASVAGVRAPMPNRILYEVYPVWRVVGRATVLVWFAGALGVAAPIDALWDTPRRTWETAALVAASVAAVVWLGGSWRGGRPRFAANETPSLSAVLAGRAGAVAEYPLFGQNNDAMGPYLLRQVFHERPLLNGAVPGTLSAELSTAAGHVDDPQAAAARQLGGVDTIVVHGDLGEPRDAPLFARLDGARVYAAVAVADPAVATWDGAYPEEEGGGARWRWLPDATRWRVTAATPGRHLVRLRLQAAPGVAIVRFGDDAYVAGEEREIDVCVVAASVADDGLAYGSVAVTADVPAPPLAPGDPRPALARVRGEHVVGRCP